MDRRTKYPDTEHFHFHNANPKNKYTTDCVIRALTLALGKEYKDVIIDTATLQIKTGYDVSESKLYGKYLEDNGWTKRSQPRHSNGKKYTVKEFVDDRPTGTYIINMANHLSVVKDGKVWDIWDCYRCGGTVGNYWTK